MVVKVGDVSYMPFLSFKSWVTFLRYVSWLCFSVNMFDCLWMSLSKSSTIVTLNIRTLLLFEHPFIHWLL